MFRGGYSVFMAKTKVDAFSSSLLNTQSAVDVLTNCVVDIYSDTGEDIDGRWYQELTHVDSVSGNFQKSPKEMIEHLDDGSERSIGRARISLSRAPAETPRFTFINGDWWKVVRDRSRENRKQYKYELEYMPDEPEQLSS